MSVLISQSIYAEDDGAVWKTAVALTAFAAVVTNPVEANSVGLGYFQGEESIPAAKFMVRWPVKELINDTHIHAVLNLQAGYGRWQHPDDSSQAGVNNAFELIPIFRFQTPYLPKWFAETSIGVAVLSRAEFGNQRFGTNFQFTDSLTIGRTAGMRNEWEVSLQYQHYSNNSNTAINDGMDFLGINLFYGY